MKKMTKNLNSKGRASQMLLSLSKKVSNVRDLIGISDYKVCIQLGISQVFRESNQFSFALQGLK